MHVPYLRVIVVADPAAGAEEILTAPGGVFWRVLSVRYTLTTDATVANRITTLISDDGTSSFWQNGVSGGQTAGTTQAYSTTTGANNFGAGAIIRPMGYPDGGVWLYPGWRLRTATENIQVADQYSGFVALVEEFHSGPAAMNAPRIPSQDR